MRCNDCELMLTSLNTRRDLYTMFIRRAPATNINTTTYDYINWDHIERAHTHAQTSSSCYMLHLGYLFFRSDWDIYRGYFILDWLNLFFRMDLCVLGITICDALLGLAVKQTTWIKIRFSLDSLVCFASMGSVYSCRHCYTLPSTLLLCVCVLTLYLVRNRQNVIAHKFVWFQIAS